MVIWEKVKLRDVHRVATKYKFCGVTLLRKEKTPSYKKVEILGIVLQNKGSVTEEVTPVDPSVETIRRSSLFDEDWYVRQYQITDSCPAEHYLKEGWKRGFNPSANFDGNVYLDVYSDVQATNICPLLHYETHRSENRLTVKTEDQPIDVLIISSSSTADCEYSWRVRFFREALSQYYSKIEEESLIDFSQEFLNKLYYAKRIIFRPDASERSLKLIRMIKRWNKKLVYDLNDSLLTSPFIDTSIFCYSKDIVVPTESLAREYQRKFGIKAVVFPYVILHKLLNQNKVQRSRQSFRLLSICDTESEKVDLSAIYLDLINFMLKHSDVTLTILGSTLVEPLQMFGDRIQVLPFSGFDEMLDVLSQHDLLLASPNSTKENCMIKYIEAGAVGTPMLVPNSNAGESNIHSGETCILYQDDLYEQLEQVYQNRELLQSISLNAHQDVEQNHSTNIDLSTIKEEILC